MPRIQVTLGGVRQKAEQRLRDTYYRRAYLRTFPGKDRIEAKLADWEVRAGKGDVPKPKAAWDDQYASGGWDFLSGVEELAHYSVIVGYAAWFKPKGSVLDVGCGAGVLHDRFLSVGYDTYVGVDISEVAVAGMRDRNLPDTAFFAEDAESFIPASTFDVVVFNESLTYFTDPTGQFERYLGFRTDGGVAIVSCHVQSARAQAVLRELESQWEVLDACEVSRGATSWRIVTFSGSRSS